MVEKIVISHKGKDVEVPPPPERCKVCGGYVWSILLFLSIEPDGWVCQKCGAFYPLEGQEPIATVIGVSQKE